LKNRWEKTGLFPSDVLKMSEGEWLFNCVIFSDIKEEMEANEYMEELDRRT